MVIAFAVVLMVLGVMTAAAWAAEEDGVRTDGLYPELAAYLEERAGEFDRISAERRAQLGLVSAFVREEARAGRAARLVFVCTHNSRRSHMSQLWAAAAAEACGVGVWTYSGGTEATAFNPRAAAAVERAGFRVEKTTEGSNPVYHVRMGEGRAAMTCFSKVYDGAPNPSEGFGAVMVCGEADEACPMVEGAAGRFGLPFEDPKVSDGTERESAVYDERCAQIAREMLWMMRAAAGGEEGAE